MDLDELGGWRLHTEITGQVDLAMDSDEEALEAVKKFLSPASGHHREAPPLLPFPPGLSSA